MPPGLRPSRRHLLAGALGLTLGPSSAAVNLGSVTVRVDTAGPRHAISPFIYGGNEIGTMDGGPPSADLDRAAGVTARRLGGNLTTTYNWTSGFSNAGKDDGNKNGDYLAEALGLLASRRRTPAAVITAMHDATRAMGAVSLITLPLAGFVAADGAGAVGPAEAAPSKRFVPVRWASDARASDPIDPRVADIPHLLRRLVAVYGTAREATGIRGYALDNEPGLWPETHPRVVPHPVPIADYLRRAVEAATAIKAIDPDAWVIGPASWGATEMATFQNAPDWAEYRQFGSFLAAYLDTFRLASERAGHRLLDALDVHWYPFSARGALFRTEDPGLAAVLLDAPRSLSEPGFREDSWVTQALPVSMTGGLALPLLPSLERLVAAWFPGTQLSISEFNYGGSGQVASGLAVADALGRFGRSSVLFAAHWGSLDGWLGQAYRLFRDVDGRGTRFGSQGLAVAVDAADRVSAFAAVEPQHGTTYVIVLNKATVPTPVDLVLAPPTGATMTAFGFDADHPRTAQIGPPQTIAGPIQRLVLPARSARHFIVTA